MTAEVLRTYRFRCDADQCTVSLDSSEHETPTDWTEISSTAHQSYGPLPSVKSGAKLLRALTANGVRTTGRFSLHLCPQHLSALNGHLPMTDGYPDGQRLVVSCSCGARLGEVSGGSAKARWHDHMRGER